MTGRDTPGFTERPRPRVVVALGGNALLRRGEPLEAANQARAAHAAAAALAQVSDTHQLVVTHGNGPQVGLLALMGDAYTETAPYPLDVLGSETEGQIGYVLELALDNAVAGQATVTVLTRVVVDPADVAFSAPSKFIGPVYPESQARSLAQEHGWTVKRDGDAWRRVVASPEPRRIVQRDAIERLVDGGFLVVCAGGGGIPVIEDASGRQRGVEAVIDKDLASALAGRGSARRRADPGHRRAGGLRRLPHRGAATDHLRQSVAAAGRAVRRRLDGTEGRSRLPLCRAHRRSRGDRKSQRHH